MCEQRFALLRAEARDTTGLADPDLFHDATGLDLAHAWQRLEQREDLELAHHIVALGLGEHFRKRDRAPAAFFRAAAR